MVAMCDELLRLGIITPEKWCQLLEIPPEPPTLARLEHSVALEAEIAELRERIRELEAQR